MCVYIYIYDLSYLSKHLSSEAIVSFVRASVRGRLPWYPTFVDRLRTSCMVPSPLSGRLRASETRPCKH